MPPVPPPPSLPTDWLDYYCNQCAGTSGMRRRLEEASTRTSPDERSRIEARVDVHLRQGRTLEMAWELVRAENEGRSDGST